MRDTIHIFLLHQYNVTTTIKKIQSTTHLGNVHNQTLPEKNRSPCRSTQHKHNLSNYLKTCFRGFQLLVRIVSILTRYSNYRFFILNPIISLVVITATLFKLDSQLSRSHQKGNSPSKINVIVFLIEYIVNVGINVVITLLFQVERFFDIRRQPKVLMLYCFVLRRILLYKIMNLELTRKVHKLVQKIIKYHSSILHF